MKFTAQELAKYGRNGDTELLHVSKKELDALRGIGSLAGVKVTRNPTTGLPEAFNFSSMIPAIVGIGASVLSGGTLSPLMAGMISGATTTAVTGDVKQGLMAGISGGAMAGLGSGLSAMGGAEQAGAAAGTLGSGTAGLGSAAGMGAEAGLGLEAGMGAGMDAGMGMGGGMPAAGPVAPPPMMSTDLSQPAFGQLGSGWAPNPDDAQIASFGAPGPETIPTGPPPSTGFSGETFMNNAMDGSKWQEHFGGEHFNTRTVPGGIALLNTMGAAMAPEPGKPKEREEPSENAKREKFGKRTYTQPEDPYYPLTGSEPTMFSPMTYAQGGITSLPDNSGDPMMKVIRQIRGRYRSKKAAIEDMQVRGSFMDKLGIRDPDHPVMQYAFGYTEKQGKKKAPESRMVAPKMMAEGGRAGEDWDRLEFRAYGEENDPYKMYLQGETVNRKSGRIVDPDAMRSRSYEINNPRAADRAAKRLNDMPRKKMAEGGMPGGDGMSDSVPAMIEGVQPAALSKEEFVVPADVVSGLGNGSSKAGGEALYAMMARVRKARTGMTEQPPPIDPNEMLPA